MADNKIANAIKFLKGEEKSLPATKTDGQVYFAYKNVGTAEKPSYTGAIYIDTPIGGTQTRIKMTANADIADKAFNDSAGASIRNTYLSSLGYTDDGKQTILIKGSGNNQTRIALPVANTTKSGIVTTDAQSFGGTKTFTTINSTNLTITGSYSFNYIGIGYGTADIARPVWFADNTGNGKPVVNINFTYNPATQTLSVANLSGTAQKASNDDGGQNIRSTYIKNITVNGTTLTFTKGGGATSSITLQDTNNKVTQTAIKSSDYTNWRTVLWGASNSATEGFAPTTVTDGVFTSETLTFQPSSGTLRAKVFKGSLSGNATTATSATKATYDSSGTKDIRSYISDITISGCTVTVTKGSGAQVTLTTQDTDTWRGIQNNLTSDSTTDSLSAAQGKYLKSLIDGKSNNGHNHDDRYYTEAEINSKLANYLPVAGGTLTGALHIKPSEVGSYNENIRIHPSPVNWSSIIMCGNDNTGDSGTSEKTWGIFTYDGQFAISKNGNGFSSTGTTYLRCDANNIWSINGNTIIHSGNYKTYCTPSNIGAAVSSHTHNYAGSASSGGAATSANKLNTNAGSTARPVYFSNGIPVQCNDPLAISISGKSASTDAINCVAGNEIRFTKPSYTSPQALHFGWAWADSSKTKLISEYRFDGGDGQLTQVTASQFNGPLNGNANTATALTSSAGSSTQPVYFSGGKPVACTYTINASVPSGAKFTDTNTWRPLGTTADTACAGNDSRLSNARPASDVYAWAKASSKPSYTKSEVGLGNVDNTADSAKSVKYATSAGSANAVAWGNVSGRPSTFTPSSHIHQTVEGVYTGEGGKQSPSYIAGSTVKFNMMNTPINGNYSYKDFILMDTYGGNDVPFVTGLGLAKTGAARAFIMCGKKGGKSWDYTAELLSTSNYTSYAAPKSHTHTKSQITDFPSSLPASDVYSWAKASSKPSYTKSEVGLGNVDNTADSQKSVKYATSAGSASSASSATTAGTCTGNSATATKLQIARTINLTGSVTGSGTFDGSGNLSITTSTNHSHSQYLPLAGGKMTGNITYDAKGTCYIGAGTNDAANMVGGTFNNLVISSWNGISFTTTCPNTTFTNKNAVSIDCRNGILAAATLRVGNGSDSTIYFCTNGDSTVPGAKIVAYSDRIEFVFA